MLEDLYCGVTNIPVLKLNIADKGLQSTDESLKITGYEAQLKVRKATHDTLTSTYVYYTDRH